MSFTGIQPFLWQFVFQNSIFLHVSSTGGAKFTLARMHTMLFPTRDFNKVPEQIQGFFSGKQED
jgi:hypothetical protein